ncbi:MAG: ATP-binding cassette domain-containing protein [Bacillota bacterium]
MEPIIEVDNLAYKYKNGTKALQEISFEVQRNSRLAILGPNGAGKTTLLFHLNALYLAQKGAVKIKGKKIIPENKDWVRSKVGLVMQDPDDQVFSTTVYEDIEFGLLNFGWEENDKIKKRIEWALTALNIFDLKDKSPHNLSYGQKKRVAIAGVLAVEPEIIIFDEPLSYLDPQGKNDLRDTLFRLHQKGITLLVVTHNIDFAAHWADRILILKEGQVLAEGDSNLLGQKELMAEANLSLPTITELFNELEIKEKNLQPKTIKEAALILNDLLGK